MRIGLIASVLCLLNISGVSAAETNPFIGRWDFNITTNAGQKACWLGIAEKNGALDIWFQPTGGNVRQVNGEQRNGSHLHIPVTPSDGKQPATTWELDAVGGKLTGVEIRGNISTPLTGNRAPTLNRSWPRGWGKPEPLFDGKTLDGWKPIGDVSNSNWLVKDGLLVNGARGANLRTDRTFTDFKVHFEVNCPDNANSGFYLRGRYEVQLEYEPANSEPKEREMGSVYGRIAPARDLQRKPGEWETFDVTLVGRTVNVVRDGVTIIDHKEIEGITGGALDANEGEPGPFYIQGDHTGSLKFRNITVALPLN